MLNSVYISNNVQDYTEAVDWLDGGLDAIQLHGGTASWTDWLSSIRWQGDLFAAQDVKVLWSVHLVPSGASLQKAGQGEYNDRYVAMAEQLVANSAGTEKIDVRLGWEFNGLNWNSSSAVGQPDNYIAAFRQFVEAARSVSDRFVFEWCPNYGRTDMNPELAYPGDAYVDVIGIDFYYDTAWLPADPVQAWNKIVSTDYGLQWQQDFAAAHGKPTAIGEWGLNSDSPEFVALAAQWFEQHNVLYQNYWDSNSAFAGKLSDGQYPEAEDAFLAEFAGDGPVDPFAPTPDPVGPTVTSAASYTLAAAEVNLQLTGTATTGIGNGKANAIRGNAGANTLWGNGGEDILYGGGGNDTLEGGDGADIAWGGLGDDRYTVENGGDRVIELAGEGIDSVYSRVSFTLSANVEHLYLEGTTGLIGTGNALANTMLGASGNDTLYGRGGSDTLRGNAGNDRLYGGTENDVLRSHAGDDVLNGGTGADTMEGGDGNDTYYVDTSGDVVLEYWHDGLGGTDTVMAVNDHTLASSVENLTLQLGANRGTGNELGNIIRGNDRNNVLDGRSGADTLVGGAGADRFRFTTALGSGNIDRIDDFTPGSDRIQIDDAIFKALPVGALNASAFHVGPAAADAQDRIVYNSQTGGVFYDADGTGAGAAFRFATIDPGLPLGVADFNVF